MRRSSSAELQLPRGAQDTPLPEGDEEGRPLSPMNNDQISLSPWDGPDGAWTRRTPRPPSSRSAARPQIPNIYLALPEDMHRTTRVVSDTQRSSPLLPNVPGESATSRIISARYISQIDRHLWDTQHPIFAATSVVVPEIDAAGPTVVNAQCRIVETDEQKSSPVVPTANADWHMNRSRTASPNLNPMLRRLSPITTGRGPATSRLGTAPASPAVSVGVRTVLLALAPEADVLRVSSSHSNLRGTSGRTQVPLSEYLPGLENRTVTALPKSISHHPGGVAASVGVAVSKRHAEQSEKLAQELARQRQQEDYDRVQALKRQIAFAAAIASAVSTLRHAGNNNAEGVIEFFRQGVIHTAKIQPTIEDGLLVLQRVEGLMLSVKRRVEDQLTSTVVTRSRPSTSGGAVRNEQQKPPMRLQPLASVPGKRPATANSSSPVRKDKSDNKIISPKPLPGRQATISPSRKAPHSADLAVAARSSPSPEIDNKGPPTLSIEFGSQTAMPHSLLSRFLRQRFSVLTGSAAEQSTDGTGTVEQLVADMAGVLPPFHTMSTEDKLLELCVAALDLTVIQGAREAGIAIKDESDLQAALKWAARYHKENTATLAGQGSASELAEAILTALDLWNSQPVGEGSRPTPDVKVVSQFITWWQSEMAEQARTAHLIRSITGAVGGEDVLAELWRTADQYPTTRTNILADALRDPEILAAASNAGLDLSALTSAVSSDPKALRMLVNTLSQNDASLGSIAKEAQTPSSDLLRIGSVESSSAPNTSDQPVTFQSEKAGAATSRRQAAHPLNNRRGSLPTGVNAINASGASPGHNPPSKTGRRESAPNTAAELDEFRALDALQRFKKWLEGEDNPQVRNLRGSVVSRSLAEATRALAAAVVERQRAATPVPKTQPDAPGGVLDSEMESQEGNPLLNSNVRQTVRYDSIQKLSDNQGQRPLRHVGTKEREAESSSGLIIEDGPRSPTPSVGSPGIDSEERFHRHERSDAAKQQRPKVHEVRVTDGNEGLVGLATSRRRNSVILINKMAAEADTVIEEAQLHARLLLAASELASAEDVRKAAERAVSEAEQAAAADAYASDIDEPPARTSAGPRNTWLLYSVKSSKTQGLHSEHPIAHEKWWFFRGLEPAAGSKQVSNMPTALTGIQEERGELLDATWQLRNALRLVEEYKRCTRACAQAALLRAERMRWDQMTEEQKMVANQRRALAKEELGRRRREEFERQTDPGRLTVTERMARSRKLAQMVMAGYPAFMIRKKYINKLRGRLIEEREEIKGIKQSCALQTAGIASEYQSRLHDMRHIAAVESVAMSVEDTYSAARERQEAEKATEWQQLEKQALQPFVPYFTGENDGLMLSQVENVKGLVRSKRAASLAALQASSPPRILSRNPGTSSVPVILSQGFRVATGLPTKGAYGTGISNVYESPLANPDSVLGTVRAPHSRGNHGLSARSASQSTLQVPGLGITGDAYKRVNLSQVLEQKVAELSRIDADSTGYLTLARQALNRSSSFRALQHAVGDKPPSPTHAALDPFRNAVQSARSTAIIADEDLNRYAGAVYMGENLASMRARGVSLRSPAR